MFQIKPYLGDYRKLSFILRLEEMPGMMQYEQIDVWREEFYNMRVVPKLESGWQIQSILWYKQRKWKSKLYFELLAAYTQKEFYA